MVKQADRWSGIPLATLIDLFLTDLLCTSYIFQTTGHLISLKHIYSSRFNIQIWNTLFEPGLLSTGLQINKQWQQRFGGIWNTFSFQTELDYTKTKDGYLWNFTSRFISPLSEIHLRKSCWGTLISPTNKDTNVKNADQYSGYLSWLRLSKKANPDIAWHGRLSKMVRVNRSRAELTNMINWFPAC